MRHVEFLDSEIATVERQIASEALRSAEIKRLMSVPGVNVICAASFMAAVGEIRRFQNPRRLTGYLGLDPRSTSRAPRRRRADTSQSKIGRASCRERV